MKAALIWVLALAVILSAGALLPFESRDVAQLVPVEVLVVSVNEDKIILDGGNCRGEGEDWAQAWEDLKKGGDGVVFLGTAEQIVLAGAAVKLLPETAYCTDLRPAANVCVSLGKLPDPKESAGYLSAHHPGVTLQMVRASLEQGNQPELPVLIVEEGRLRFYETEHW